VKRFVFWLFSLLFFFSGATGLLYEVLWFKHLALLFGKTALAQTIVLATFLGGLALGNSWLGKRADRSRNPLRLYAHLELGIAVLAPLTPALIAAISSIYFSLVTSGASVAFSSLVRTMASVAALLLPTMLMGGTLPALSRYAAAGSERTQESVSWFYSVNSAGAVLGCLAAGFIMIPTWGLDLSVSLTAGANLLIGVVALLVARSSGDSPAPAKVEPCVPAPAQKTLILILAVVFLGGWASLAFEVAWIRLLSMVMGSSTYSFSIMLSAFIAGLSLGSYLVSRGVCRRWNPGLALAFAEAGVSLSILLTLPLYERLPWVFLLLDGVLRHTPANFYIFEGIKFLFSFSLMLLPTCFLGMTLPLAVDAFSGGAHRLGRDVGGVFSWNALGNVLGAITAGLWLLPALGIQRLIEAGVAVDLVLASALVWTFARWGRGQKAAALGACWLTLAGIFVLSPAWDQALMTSGGFRSIPGRHYPSYQRYRADWKSLRVRYYKDDAETTVAVLESPNPAIGLVLKLNGKVDATSSGDMPNQLLMGHIPLLLKPDAKDALLVGLGSGVTAGSALRHPLERLDVVEISGGVADAAKLFKDYNYDALSDPRLALHIEDAHAFIHNSSRSYDLIMSEPSNAWVAGIGDLFSAEFYREAKARLKDGGLMAQWLHLYEMNDATVQVVLHTFASEFQDLTLWETTPGNDIIIVGSKGPLKVDFKTMEKRFGLKPVRTDLARIGIEDLPDLLSLQVAAGAPLAKQFESGQLNEEKFPILEYQAPKTYFLQTYAKMMDFRPRREMQGLLFLWQAIKTRGKDLSRDEIEGLVHFHLGRGAAAPAKFWIEELRRRFPRVRLARA
jgi:spermidine synthase